jgi:hypothetical protein
VTGARSILDRLILADSSSIGFCLVGGLCRQWRSLVDVVVVAAVAGLFLLFFFDVLGSVSLCIESVAER